MKNQEIYYNFEPMLEALYHLSTDPNAQPNRQLLLTELNKFFVDFTCAEVLITNNTDNDFFGIQIYPRYTKSTQTILTEEHPRFRRYLLEFDSKLFNGDFTLGQILALLIHDIHKISSPEVLQNILFAFTEISHRKCGNIYKKSMQRTDSFFKFAVADTARKMTSAFEYIAADACIAGDFLKSYGLHEYYEDAIIILKNKGYVSTNNTCPTITLNWYADTYYNTNTYYSNIIEVFNDAIQFTGSRILRRMMNDIVVELKGRSDLLNGYYTSLTESKKPSLVSRIKTSGIKSLEDDVYEYRMRVKNLNTENEAIHVVRQINSRMNIISDYLDTEELSDKEKERCYKLYDKYDSIRDELSKKAIYDRKMYGLFVDYNALQQMSNTGSFNTYY